MRQTSLNLPLLRLLAAVFWGGTSGCNAVPPTPVADHRPQVVPATRPVAEPGSEAQTPHFSMTLKGSRPCTVEPHLAPPDGVKKFAVEVEVQGLSQVEVPANPFYATLMTEQGQQYESTLAGCAPLLTAQRLTRGQSARGWITFDIPDAARPTSLLYRPAIIGVGSPEVELQLGP